MGNAPKQKYRAGSIVATIWENKATDKKTNKEYTSYSVNIQRGYKDTKGEWQNTDSLRTNDIPKALLVLNKAYEYLAMQVGREDDE